MFAMLPPGGSIANIAPCTLGIDLSSYTVFGHSVFAAGRKSSYHFR